jgi:large subunit ribosomal protein L1
MGGRKTKLIQAEEEAPKAKPSEEKLSEAKAASGGKVKKSAGPRVKKIRGRKYQEAKKKVEVRTYPAEEAVRLVKETSTTGFDASVDAHINLGLEAGKTEHQLRSFLALPHGTGKTIRVLVFAEGSAAKAATEAGADKIGDDATLEEIGQGKVPDFGAVIATPNFMPKLAKVARVLGPKGLMPTPKTGTVTEDPAAMVSQLKKGRVEIKTEAQPIVHVSIGKVSFSETDLMDNLKAVVEELNRVKPSKIQGTFIRSVFLAPTMGPSVKVDLDTLK